METGRTIYITRLVLQFIIIALIGCGTTQASAARDSITIEGVVYDYLLGDGLPDAQIWAWNTYSYTTSQARGYYKLQLPDSLIGKTVMLRVSYPACPDRRISVLLNSISLQQDIPLDLYNVMDIEPIVIYPKPGLFQRLKRLFQ